MENLTVACMQPRFGVLESQEAFAALARRFLRQAQAKSVQLCIFPELTGLMLAPPLISGFTMGLVKQADRGRKPDASFVARRLGRVADSLGGGLGGGLKRLLNKNGDALRDSYRKTFGELAREFGTAILAGSLFEVDAESRQIRNRATLFDAGGEVVGWQDKLNPAEEGQICSAGSELVTLETQLGRMGILIGNDALVPELARLLVLQGADLIVGIAASSSVARANALRTALALRAEENQVYGAASFLVGPNFLAQGGRGEWVGQSALLAPFELTEKGDGVLAQVGSNRSEGAIFATLQAERLELLRRSGGFRPRQEMNLAGMAPVLAEMYARGLSLEQAIEKRLAGPVGSAVSEAAPEAGGEPAAAAGEGPDLPVDRSSAEA